MAMTSPATFPDPQHAYEPPTSYLPGATPPVGGQPVAEVNRTNRRNWFILGAAGLALISFFAGIGVGGAGTPQAKTLTISSPSPYPVVSTVTKTVEAKPAAPAAPPPPPPAATISTGQWIVGDDFPAGTYEVTSDSDSCYWDITRSGSNHHDYIQQELGRGHWKIALKQGYDFTTKDCGLWRKVG